MLVYLFAAVVSLSLTPWLEETVLEKPGVPLNAKAELPMVVPKMERDHSLITVSADRRIRSRRYGDGKTAPPVARSLSYTLWTTSYVSLHAAISALGISSSPTTSLPDAARSWFFMKSYDPPHAHICTCTHKHAYIQHDYYSVILTLLAKYFQSSSMYGTCFKIGRKSSDRR